MKRNGCIHWLTLAATVALTAGCREHRSAATPPPGMAGPAAAPERVAKTVMPSRLAGSWYPAEPAKLAAQLHGFFNAATVVSNREWRALILPHAGYAYSGATAAVGVKAAAGRAPRRVIVLGPSHHAAFRNAICLPAVTHVATPLGEVALDRDFIAGLAQDPVFRPIPEVQEAEHSVQMEIPLLQAALKEFTLVPLVVGQLDRDTLRHAADVLAARVDADTLVIASSDFTHYGPNYGYLPFREDVEANLRKLDMGAFAQIAKKDAAGFLDYCESTGATICGRDPIAILLAMQDPDVPAELMAYDTSGRQLGDFENSVSYLAIGFAGRWTPRPAGAETRPPGAELSVEDQRALLQLARRTLERFYAGGRAPPAQEPELRISAAMQRVRAAFVTLMRADGSLRGCIGEIYPTRPLHESVRRNAISAATEDPRFDPVTAAELPALHLEISALTPPVPVSSYTNIVLGKHGIVLVKNHRRAVFLPQVAPEQKWDLETTLNHLSLKAGLPADAWREGAEFLVFEAIVFGEGGV